MVVSHYGEHIKKSVPPRTPLFGDSFGLRSSSQPYRENRLVRPRAWAATGGGWSSHSASVRWDSSGAKESATHYPYRRKRVNGYLTFEDVARRPPDLARVSSVEPQPEGGAAIEPPDLATLRTPPARGRSLLAQPPATPSRMQITSSKLVELAVSATAAEDEDAEYPSSTDELESVDSIGESDEAEAVPAGAPRGRSASPTQPGSSELPPLSPFVSARALAARQWRRGAVSVLRAQDEAGRVSEAEKLTLAKALSAAIAHAGPQRELQALAAARAVVAAKRGESLGGSGWHALLDRVSAELSEKSSGPHAKLLAELRTFSLREQAYEWWEEPEAHARYRRAFEAKHASATRRAVELLEELGTHMGAEQTRSLLDGAIADIRANRYGAVNFDEFPQEAAGVAPPTEVRVRIAPADEPPPEPLAPHVEARLTDVREQLRPKIFLEWQAPPGAHARWRYQLEVATVCPYRGQRDWRPLYSGSGSSFDWTEIVVAKWAVAPDLLELGGIDDYLFRTRTVTPHGASAFAPPLFVSPPRATLRRVRARHGDGDARLLQRIDVLDVIKAEAKAADKRVGAAPGTAGSVELPTRASSMMRVLRRWLLELRTVFRDACLSDLEEKAELQHVYSMNRTQFHRFVRDVLDVPKRAVRTEALDTIFVRVRRERRSRGAPPGGAAADGRGLADGAGGRAGGERATATIAAGESALARPAAPSTDALALAAAAAAIMPDAAAAPHEPAPGGGGGGGGAVDGGGGGVTEAAQLERLHESGVLGRNDLVADEFVSAMVRLASLLYTPAEALETSRRALGAAAAAAAAAADSSTGAEPDELEREAHAAIAADRGGAATKLDMLMRQRVLPSAYLAIGTEQAVDVVLNGRVCLAMLFDHEEELGRIFDYYSALDISFAERLDTLNIKEWMTMLEDGGFFEEGLPARRQAARAAAAPREPAGGARLMSPGLRKLGTAADSGTAATSPRAGGADGTPAPLSPDRLSWAPPGAQPKKHVSVAEAGVAEASRRWLPVRLALRTFVHVCLDADRWEEAEEEDAGHAPAPTVSAPRSAAEWAGAPPERGAAEAAEAAIPAARADAAGGGVTPAAAAASPPPPVPARSAKRVLRARSAYDFAEMSFHQFTVAVCRLCYEKLRAADGEGEGEPWGSHGARGLGQLPRSVPTEHAFVKQVDAFLADFTARYAPLLSDASGRAGPSHAGLAISRPRRSEHWRSNFLENTRPLKAATASLSARRALRKSRFSIVGRASQAASRIAVADMLPPEIVLAVPQRLVSVRPS